MFVYVQCRSPGYFDLKDIDMSRVINSAHAKNIKLIRHEKNIIYKKTFKRINADSFDEAKDFAISSACLL